MSTPSEPFSPSVNLQPRPRLVYAEVNSVFLGTLCCACAAAADKTNIDKNQIAIFAFIISPKLIYVAAYGMGSTTPAFANPRNLNAHESQVPQARSSLL